MSGRKSKRQESTREPTFREQAALEWVVRCDQGLTEAQQIEFDQWKAKDAQHAELFDEFGGTWSMFDRLHDIQETSVESIFPQGNSAVSKFIAEPALDSSESKRRFRFQRAIRFLLPAAAAALLAFAYVGWWRPAHFTKAFDTTVGNSRKIDLPDGSSVELNTDSSLSVAFSAVERLVRLERGEAHFSVAKNSARPFIVEANGVSVRAVGTAFNVRLRPAAVEVLVTEGKVQVDDSIKGESLLPAPALREETVTTLTEPTLVAGQRFLVALPTLAQASVSMPSPSVEVLTPDEVHREMAWKEQRLEFVAAPLAVIVIEFNRYNRHKIVVADAQLAAKRFGGSFQSNDPARFVRMLADNYAVAVEEHVGETVLGSLIICEWRKWLVGMK